MNYIWEQLIQTVQDGLKPSDIHFTAFRNNVSPHLEMLVDVSLLTKLNETMLLEIDVNPYMRFSKIFYALTKQELGDVQNEKSLIEVPEYTEFNMAIVDVIFHYLAEVDWMTGLTKQDLHIALVIRSIENGMFGDIEIVSMLNMNEKVVLANQVLALYRTADNLACMIRVISKVFSFCQVVVRDGEELILYFREPYDKEIDVKVHFITKIFLPISITFAIHWSVTYGVVGYDNTMFIEEFIL